MSQIFTNPVYDLFIKLRGVPVDIYVNGVIVYQREVLRGVSFYLPKNELLVKGRNALNIVLKKTDANLPNDYYVEVELHVKQAKLGGEGRIKLMELKDESGRFEEGLIGGLVSTEAGLRLGEPAEIITEKTVIQDKDDFLSYKREFSLPDYGFMPSWTSAENLLMNDSHQLHTDLYQLYGRLWNLFNDRNLPSVKHALDIKTSDVARAYYLDKNDVWSNSFRIEKLLLNRDVEVGELVPVEQTRVQIGAGGRMAKLIDVNINDEVIYFRNNVTREESSYEFWFGKISGQWAIVR